MPDFGDSTAIGTGTRVGTPVIRVSFTQPQSNKRAGGELLDGDLRRPRRRSGSSRASGHLDALPSEDSLLSCRGRRFKAMDATATIAQLGIARQQAERADYRGALINFDAVLQKLEQCGP